MWRSWSVALRTVAAGLVAIGFAALLGTAQIIDKIEHNISGEHLCRLVLDINIADGAVDALVLSECIENANIDFGLFVFEEFVAETAVEKHKILIKTVGKSCISEMREVGTQNKAFAEKPIEPKAGIVVDEIGIEFGAEFVARHIVIGSISDVKIYIFADVAAQKYASVGIEVVGFIEFVIDERRQLGKHRACAKGKIAFDFGDGHGISNIAIDVVVAVEIDALRELRTFVQNDIRSEHGVGLGDEGAIADIVVGIIYGQIDK